MIKRVLIYYRNTSCTLKEQTGKRKFWTLSSTLTTPTDRLDPTVVAVEADEAGVDAGVGVTVVSVETALEAVEAMAER